MPRISTLQVPSAASITLALGTVRIILVVLVVVSMSASPSAVTEPNMMAIDLAENSASSSVTLISLPKSQVINSGLPLPPRAEVLSAVCSVVETFSVSR